MLDTLPGTRFLYNPPDTMLLIRAVREAVKDDRTFWAMPLQPLFWEIGMTRTMPASDWNGDFLMSGQTYSTARDFARFGLLYLNKGVWNGERILPEGWTNGFPLRVRFNLKATVRGTAASFGCATASMDCPPARIRRAADRVRMR